MKAPTLVVSDVHLSPADPAGIERFVRFLRGPASEAASVVIAGDLFEFWVTPAQVRDPSYAPLFCALRDLAGAGVRLGFVEGNRDFAASPALRAAGVATLADVVVLVSGAADDGGGADHGGDAAPTPGARAPFRVVVTHGDRLCRKDVRYQAFRRAVRTPLVRHILRAAPSSLAHGSGRAARAGSRMETARKAEGDMGLDAGAVADCLRAADADALVCGHVHWGRRHRIDVDGAERDVIVLGAWDAGDATFARVEGGHVAFVRFEGGPTASAEPPLRIGDRPLRRG